MGGTTFSASPATVNPKTYYYIAKGSKPWYNNKSDGEYQWPDRGKVINIDESVSGQATVTCKEVTDMSSMFWFCSDLTSLDLSNFDTSNVTDMSDMFVGGVFTSLDLSNFNTSNVTNMSAMFDACEYLTNIKGIIDMKSCKDYNDMFYNCPKIKGVKIKNPPAGFDGAGLSKSQYTIVS